MVFINFHAHRIATLDNKDDLNNGCTLSLTPMKPMSRDHCCGYVRFLFGAGCVSGAFPV
jgi:hypothetical protein